METGVHPPTALAWQVQGVQDADLSRHTLDLPCLSRSVNPARRHQAHCMRALHRSVPPSASSSKTSAIWGSCLATSEILLAGVTNPPLWLNWLKLQFEHTQEGNKSQATGNQNTPTSYLLKTLSTCNLQNGIMGLDYRFPLHGMVWGHGLFVDAVWAFVGTNDATVGRQTAIRSHTMIQTQRNWIKAT